MLANTWERDRPWSFGPFPIGKYTLVASTYSSRREKIRLSRAPVIRSLAPSAYMSAVSKNVMPPSAARRTMGSAAASSRCQALHESLSGLAGLP